MDMINITAKAEEIFVFNDFQHWVNKASSRIGGFKKDEKIICLDISGRVCTGGFDMAFARDNNLFPVTAYRLIRSSETVNVEEPCLK